jgi:hypothetical protein
VVVDVISLTDSYRLRASMFSSAPAGSGLRRYATAAPHASGGGALPEVVFEAMKCNRGAAISLSKVRDALYLRPLILGLFASIGETRAAKRALPPDAPFALAPVSAELEGVNHSGWEAFSVDELRRRYGGRANYLEQARQKAAALVTSRYLLEEDESAAIQDVEA